MDLDTTILQSKTAIELVKFIDKVFDSQDVWNVELYLEYQEVKKEYDKAIKRRNGNSKYNTNFVDLDEKERESNEHKTT